jgi:glycosyltransferase involved in cell wall biosynthesis
VGNEDICDISRHISALIQNESASAVLMIASDSAFSTALGEALHALAPQVDFLTLQGTSLGAAEPQLQPPYDVVILAGVVAQLPPTKANALIDDLLPVARKQVLLIEPSGGAAQPLQFIGYDFSYIACNENYLLFSFFHKKIVERLAIDTPKEIPALRRRLRLAYVIPHLNLTGGMKAILTQIYAMARAGHSVAVYYRGAADRRVLPFWSGADTDGLLTLVSVPIGESYRAHIKDADIILLGWVGQVPEFMHSTTPVALWEQGSEPLFGDYYGNLIPSGAAMRTNLRRSYASKIHMLAVSDLMQKILKERFGRESPLFPNIIDTELYHPGEDAQNDPPVILLVGYPQLPFKGFSWAIDVLKRLSETKAAFRVCWASPSDFALPQQLPFALEKQIGLPQQALAALYRRSDILFSSSRYESFSLPPLEAMASGTAVVMTDNGGCRMYAEDGKNCALIPQGDTDAAVSALRGLLGSKAERLRMGGNGRATALRFCESEIVRILEDALYSIVG